MELQRLDADYRYRGGAQYLGFAETFPDLDDGVDRAIDRQADGDSYGVFVTNQWQVNSRLVVETGVRWDKQGYVDLSNDTQVSPRINVLFSPGSNTDIRASWGRYFQPQSIQELQVEDGVARFFPAQRADHSILGIEHRFSDELSMRAELYRKDMGSLRPRYENLFNPLALIPELAPDRIRVAPTAARSEGLELSFGYRHPSGTNVWASYVLSRVEDDIEGRKVPRSWDQRHSLQLGAGIRYGRWDLSLAGRLPFRLAPHRCVPRRESARAGNAIWPAEPEPLSEFCEFRFSSRLRT